MNKKVYLTDYQKWDLITRICHKLNKGDTKHALLCSVAYLLNVIDSDEYYDLTGEYDDVS